ncbi:MAG TPA: DNA mismatch repair endonuclease MutL [Firmicutes bacterium]|nr:DNA mismatch repair endonuclease MutL [Bacillota bacterium]
MKINVLPPGVYNKIAAGEVVDRPYSVVKELVENAIDAGATQITVEIEKGGKKSIRVTDNGSGMDKEDLPLAYSSHATSKLYKAEDLFSIHTLGFRGEAIASVAAVSRMEIVSCVQGGEAYSLSCEGGVLGSVVPAAGAKGTVVTVNDLFYNVPARLKFLKSDTQEEADIGSVMARFLLSRPEISFEYIADGKRKYQSFGDGLSAALVAVYGADALANCIEIRAEKHGIRLHGFLGNRNYFKANRTYQSLFVNGRFVVNQTVGAAVTNAYASYLMKRQYPFYVLFLDVPPEVVDVNVHPNKADVRFADNQIIYGCVYSVVSAVLDGNSRALEYIVSMPEQNKTPVQDSFLTGQAGQAEFPKTAQDGFGEQKQADAQQQKIGVGAGISADTNIPVGAKELAAAKISSGAEMHSEQKNPVGINNSLDAGISPLNGQSAEIPGSKTAEMTYEQAKKELAFDVTIPKGQEPHFLDEEPVRMEVRQPVSATVISSNANKSQPAAEEDAFAQNQRYLWEQAARMRQERVDPDTLEYKGELFRTYLIYQSGDCAYFIDQHAAHERILFDRLKQAWENRTVSSQPMLIPFVLLLNGQEFAFLEKNFPVLRDLGFEVEEFGDQSVRVLAIPTDLMGIDLAAFFRDVLSSMESLRAIRLSDLLKDKLATAACKAAVKGGEKLDEMEVRALIAQMDGDTGMKCPHGRPAVVKMKKSEFEKLFKRIV